MEFRKNRQRAIIDNSKETKLNIDVRLPAVMEDSSLSSILKRTKSDLEKRKKEHQKRIENIISNPALYDPVHKNALNNKKYKVHLILCWLRGLLQIV